MGPTAILDPVCRVVARNQERLRTPEALKSMRAVIKSPGGISQVAHRASEVLAGSAGINAFARGIAHVSIL